MTDMKIRATVVCLPVRDLERTLEFYKATFGFSDAQIEEGMIALELPNLSLFLMEKDAFEAYSRKAGRGAWFPDGAAGMVISCAIGSKEHVDIISETASEHGGTASSEAAMDEASGGYTAYVADPDGHLWELVFPQPTGAAG